VGVERFADKSLLFTLREIYGRHLYLPASLISDGTINIAALIIAVYFQQRPLIIIEEPERNVHPFLISRIVSHLKDASERRQIIVSTHNPEFVRHADLDSILLVSRDGQGFSSVARPAERQDVRTFMRHDIGADDLYVQSLLGV
jgi:predicted ATPase